MTVEWRVIAASAIGTSHLDLKTECQDRFANRLIDTQEGKVLIAVVADGAGSTSEGGVGAEIACRVFIEQIEAFLLCEGARIGLLGTNFAEGWIAHFQEKIVKTALDSKHDIREYASTLVAAVIGEREAVFFQVGDGGIVFSVDGAKGSYLFALEPEDWEYANVTDFLTDEDAAARVKFRLFEGKIEDLVLFSDGVYSVAVDEISSTPFEPFLVPMMAPVRNAVKIAGLDLKLKEFLSSEKMNKKTDDDKTLLLASRAV